MQKRDKQELIDSFFNEGLSKEDTHELLQKMEEDDALKAEFQLRQQMEQLLNTSNQRTKANEIINQLGQKYETPPLPKNNIRTLIISIVIAVVVLLLLFIWKLSQPRNLYQKYAHHPSVNLVERGTQAQLIDAFEVSFNQQDYEQAFQLAQQGNAFEEDLQLKLLKGIAALETSHFEQANVAFESISATNSAYKEQAIWYSALTAVKQKKWAKAQEWLNKIPQGSEWYTSAQSLAKEIPE